MNKKLLFYGVATLMIAALTSGLYLSKDQQVYKARTSSDDAEPGNMGWAQIDLRTGEYDPSLRNEVFNLIKNKGSRGDAQITLADAREQLLSSSESPTR